MASGPGDDEREWRFSVEEFDDDPDPESEGSVTGSMATDEPLEPEPIDLENAAFMLLGVLLMLWLAASVYVTFFI